MNQTTPNVNPAGTEIPERLYTERETAQRLGCARMSLFRWRQEGRIAHYRIGHRVFYSDRQIAVFLASVERQPTPQR
jgi:predicted site-specific integrase-resolvase